MNIKLKSMAGTYSQIYIQVVFAVKGRQSLLRKPWREKVFSYMSGIITEKKQKAIIVNGVEDHVHIFFGIKPSISISDLVRDIKNNSSNYINKNQFIQEKFSWQGGFGAFSYGKSQIENVYHYILNQEEHHRKKSFRAEYLELLQKFDVDYDEKYLFDWNE